MKSVYSTNSKDQSWANSVYSTNWKDPSAANSAYSTNRQDRSEKNKLDQSKTNRGGILKFLWSPGIDSKELIPPAYALAGLYNNPIPARFLSPLDCSKVPAPCWYFRQSIGTRNKVGIGLLYRPPRARICKPFKEPRIYSQPVGLVRHPTCCTGSPGSLGWPNQFLGIDSSTP